MHHINSSGTVLLLTGKVPYRSNSPQAAVDQERRAERSGFATGGSWRRSTVTWSASILLAISLFSLRVPAVAEASVLYAWKAALTGNLKLQDEKQAATIHFWNKPDDTITWRWAAPAPGSYRAELKYSLHPAMQGGRISLTVGEQRMLAPAQPT
jgi:hypothetical protein